MPLAEMPLKVKIIGIAILAILAFSVVGATWGAIDQVAQDTSAGSQASGGQSISQIGNAGEADDSMAVRTFNYVCPFH